MLVDSAIEHYRGSFHNKAMVAPIVTAALSLGASAHGNGDRRSTQHVLRHLIYAAAGLTGLVGTGFHLFNITKKPGGFSWENLFYSAPIGAPAALILSGAVGFLAERVCDTPPGVAPQHRGRVRRPGRGGGDQLASATDRYPGGLANSSGLVGKYLMTQSNQAVFGTMEKEVRWSKGPPSLSITEHWNYEDRKDFAGDYCWMAQGPLPIEWVTVQTGSRGLWGQALLDEMEKDNHQVGLKMVGEMLPDARETVTLDEERDQYGLRVARVTYSWGDNDKALIQHALGQMQTSQEAVGARDIFRQENDINHLAGTARMGFDPASSVVNADCRNWDVPNLWVCDGSVFPTTGGVNPSLTITAIAMRTADRIKQMAARGEL